jgi:signal transduction histidine kinase
MLDSYKQRELENSKLLAQQAKMVALGEMIGNIAHQWRQPLSAISMIASGTKTQIEFELINNEEIDKNLEAIVEQTQFLSKTLDNFRNFVSKNQEKEDVSFCEILNKAVLLVEPLLGDSNIKIIKHCELDTKIYGFKNELIQAIFNVLNNSRELLIEKIDSIENRYIFITTKKENNLFQIIITDSAGGISKENKAKIFEPYFTTKHQSSGKGLGLALTYKVITEYHDGKIEVQNEEFTYENKNLSGVSFIFTFKTDE